MQAKGTFEVKITPVEGVDLEKNAGVGHMTLDKKWSGDLEGTSQGTMITSMTEPTGAMAYAALEKVDAKLADKTGSFYFSHAATMIKGDAKSAVLKITVVAASGTGELAGLSGGLTIDIDANGAHTYVFNYDLP